ncbi:hypothetical protein [Novosphingobium sp.]|uniref:hypothetical protein n=1 Tax=Novosphingobium sp. TaxID=1874826 RepID=UPI0025F18DE2|nr:hypothetical protein [Novosphingobium sp.]
MSRESLEADLSALADASPAQLRKQWHRLLARAYDDGGISGGTLERPALQCLLADTLAAEHGCDVREY